MVAITQKWTFKAKTPVLGLELGPSSVNKQFFLAYTKSGSISIFSLDGKLLFQDELTDNQPIWYAKLTRMHDDDKILLIIGGQDGLLRVFNLKSSFSLKPLWAHQFGASISGILLNDINNDNYLDILAYSIDKSLRVLNLCDGSLIWGQLFEDGIGDTIVSTDDSNQNTKEVLACGNDGTVRVFRGTDGELLWFKKYSDKIRCISYLHSNKQEYVICGGDDKKLHIINKINKEEIKTIDFNNYVWKSITFPPQYNNSLLVSSYSFAFFDETIPIEEIQFNSKLVCINSQLKINWELKDVNVETINYIETSSTNLICIGTTKGDLILLNEKTGQIISRIKQTSALNSIKYDTDSHLLFTCHDDGHIYAYFLDDI